VEKYETLRFRCGKRGVLPHWLKLLNEIITKSLNNYLHFADIVI